jgi:hypothetical protein
MRRKKMVETRMLLDDGEITLIEDVLDEYFTSSPQDYTFIEKSRIDQKLKERNISLSNEDILVVWRALLKASPTSIEEENFDSVRGKFEQLSLMLSV